MFSAIISSLGGVFINKFIDGALAAFTAYQNKQISVEQLKDQLYGLMVNAARDVEISHADTLAKTYASFMDAMKTNKLLQVMWAFTVGTQLFVLVWSQFFVPLLFAYAILPNWKAGTTGEWAYLLLGACLGLGPLVLRNGPGAMSTDKIKAMITK
jgi:hypothetical protein